MQLDAFDNDWVTQEFFQFFLYKCSILVRVVRVQVVVIICKITTGVKHHAVLGNADDLTKSRVRYDVHWFD